MNVHTNIIIYTLHCVAASINVNTMAMSYRPVPTAIITGHNLTQFFPVKLTTNFFARKNIKRRAVVQIAAEKVNFRFKSRGRVAIKKSLRKGKNPSMRPGIGLTVKNFNIQASRNIIIPWQSLNNKGIIDKIFFTLL